MNDRLWGGSSQYDDSAGAMDYAAPGRSTLTGGVDGQLQAEGGTRRGGVGAEEHDAGGVEGEPKAEGGEGEAKEATSVGMDVSGGADPFDFSQWGGAPAEGGAMGGDAKAIGTTTTVAATWKDHGQFKWWIKWTTDGRKGWIVQKITNTYSGTKKDGTAITNASVGANPSYYECWEVTTGGAIRVSSSDARNLDQWERPGQGDGSKGNWSMKGEVYWTNKDPAASGLTYGGASNAGVLLSGFSAPAGLGGKLLTRNASGTWDSTGAKKSHKGTATP